MSDFIKHQIYLLQVCAQVVPNENHAGSGKFSKCTLCYTFVCFRINISNDHILVGIYTMTWGNNVLQCLFLWRDVICLWLVNQNGLPHKQLLQLFLFIIIIINLFIPPTSKTWRWRNNKLWTMSFRDTCLPVIFLSRPAGVGHSFTLLASWCSGWNSWAAGPDWKQSPLCQRQRNKYVFTFRSFLESPCCSPFALLDTVILPVQSDSVSCRKYSRPVNFVTICHSTTRNLIPWDLMR